MVTPYQCLFLRYKKKIQKKALKTDSVKHEKPVALGNRNNGTTQKDLEICGQGKSWNALRAFPDVLT